MSRSHLLLASLLVSGCVDFKPEPLELSATAMALESRTLSEAGLRTFIEENRKQPIRVWPIAVWDFETLCLASLYFHPDLEIARAQWRSSVAAEKTASARSNPTVSLTPEYAVNPESSMSPWLAAINFDVPVETAGKRTIRMQRARLLSDAARLHVVATSWQIRKQLREALFERELAQRRVNLLEKRVVLQDETLSLYEERKRVGESAESEILPFRIAHQTATIDLGTSIHAAADALSRVAAAIGLPVSALEGVAIRVEIDPAPVSPDEARRKRRFALENRSDIRETLSLYEASQTTLQLEVAKQYPDVHLGSGYQYDQGENKWAIGVGIELPVFNRNEGPIAEAYAKRQEAAARVRAAQAAAINEVDSALLAANAAVVQVTNAQRMSDASRKNVRSLEEQAARGAEDRLQVLVARSDQIAGELIVLETRITAARARAGLDDAVQVSDDEIVEARQEAAPTASAATREVR